MSRSCGWIVAAIATSWFLLATAPAYAQRERASFDDGWRFLRGDAAGAELESFNDENWRLLDLPHDFSIEDLPTVPEQSSRSELRGREIRREVSWGDRIVDELPKAQHKAVSAWQTGDGDGLSNAIDSVTRIVNGPFDSMAPGGTSDAFTWGGVAWYRKTFDVPANWAAKRVSITFDGVYHDATIWLNGKKLLAHPYGYTSFFIELSEFLHFGEKNVIAVQVDTRGRHTRWYSGSGIYRHVWMEVAAPLRVTTWGTAITTPVLRDDSATVIVRTMIHNDIKANVNLALDLSIRDALGTLVVTRSKQLSVASSTTEEVEQSLIVPRPAAWSPDHPALYSLVTELMVGGTVVDRLETAFGIRTISFDTTNGFMLNGQTMKLRGGCVHHDNGALGSTALDRAEERRVELLKAAGFNAIRTSHNPPSPAFLDACDRLGMLVVDEAFDCWTKSKNPDDYARFFEANWQADLRSIVERDRNHPSIILWSIGNEVPEQGTREGNLRTRQLAELVRAIDSSRPVTIACTPRMANNMLSYGFVSVILLAQFLAIIGSGTLQRGLRTTPWIAFIFMMAGVTVWLYFRTGSPWKAGLLPLLGGGGLLGLRTLIIRRPLSGDRSKQQPAAQVPNHAELASSGQHSPLIFSAGSLPTSRESRWHVARDCVPSTCSSLWAC